MGFVPFENTIKLEPVFNWNGQTVENVHYFIVDETPSVDTATDLANAYITWYASNLMAWQPATCQLMKVKATIMETESSPGVEIVPSGTYDGNNVSPGLPNNVTAAVRWVTALRGRSYRGRSFHIGLCESQVDDSYLTSITTNGLKEAYDELISLTVDVGPAILGVASRVHNGQERSQGVITPVINCVVENTVDSQRRRLPGRGR